MFCTFFTSTPVTNWDTASLANTRQYSQFFWQMIERGVYLAPSQFEAGFMSLAHTSEVIEKTITKVAEALAGL